ncbi:MAG TPA: cytochrome C oxidase subunit IV family protein [Saprospiraceae bacterium]|nr:cytochrome C oxidase subunit IV family protein [Saprospiraceae bacterium]HMP22778.1 cytochrome C oxidase subunit IV family protein [Saprospiraceae bacterium]
MSTLSYEASKKRVFFGLGLLAAVTLVEVFVSLLGKGHVIKGAEDYSLVIYTAGIIIIVLSLYKAYFIIFEFMHMKYEVKGLALSVLLPTALLIWAIIAFFQEGDSWKNRREQIKAKDAQPAEKLSEPQGMLPSDTYIPENWL